MTSSAAKVIADMTQIIPLRTITHIGLSGYLAKAADAPADGIPSSGAPTDVSQEKRIPAGQPHGGEWMSTAGEEAAYADEWKKKLANDDAIDLVPLLDENAEKPKSVESYAYGKVKAVLKADPSLAQYGVTALFPQPDLSDAGLMHLADMGEGGDGWYSKWRDRLASHDISSIPGMTARKLSRVFGVMGDGTSPRDDYAYTLRAMDRLRHGLWQSPEDVEKLEKYGLLGKFGTYGIDPEEIDGAIHDQPLPRVINTRTGLTNKKLGVDYSKATDFRKLYNYTQGVLGKGGVAVDVWMTRMFFRADSAPNRYQYDYVEGRVKHMAEVMSKKTGKHYSSEDVQAMLWVGYKVFIADHLKGYQAIIRAHGNDKAKKLLKPLDASIDQSLTPGDADSIIRYSGMAKGDDFAASGHGDGHSNITSYKGGSEGLAINPIPYLTVHKVIAENRDALVKLIDDDVVKNGYAGRKDIFGNVNAAIEIYKAHLEEFDEKHISLEYGTTPWGERMVTAVGAKGEIAKLFRSYLPRNSVFEIKSSKTEGTNIRHFDQSQIGFGYTYGNKSVAGVADPVKMKAAMEADPKLKAGLLTIAGMLKTKAKMPSGQKSDDLGTALAKMAQFAALTYPDQVPKGIKLSYEPSKTSTGVLDGPIPASGGAPAAAGRHELRKGANHNAGADEPGRLSRGDGWGGSSGPRLDNSGRNPDLGRGGSGGRPGIRVEGLPSTLLVKSTEARVPKGQPHGGEWAKSPASVHSNEYADKRMDILPLHSAPLGPETEMDTDALLGYAAQPEYPPVTSVLENHLLCPAPRHAATVLADYLGAHSIDFRGILPNFRQEYRPDLSGEANAVTGKTVPSEWSSLSDGEKAGRVAASTLQAFAAMESVVRVNGDASPSGKRLGILIEDLQGSETSGSVLGGAYDSKTNLLKIDLTAADSLIHEFSHYLDTSAEGGNAPASHTKKDWIALAQDLNDTTVHEMFAQRVVARGSNLGYIQTPTEMIARFFEGYVMHQSLKRGVDIAPAFISPTSRGNQPTLATTKGRRLLNFEPYTYPQYEVFGGILMNLLRGASLTKGLGDMVIVLVDSLVKSVRDVSGEARGEDGKWVRGSGNASVETIEDSALLKAYTQAIHSPKFKAWFGDWDKAEGSKVTGEGGKPAVNTHTHSVVEEDGEPVAVYHGTSHGGFTEFDKSKLDPGALWGAGFYFTQDKGIAESYQTKGSLGYTGSFHYNTSLDNVLVKLEERIAALFAEGNPDAKKRRKEAMKQFENFAFSSEPDAQLDAINILQEIYGVKTSDLLEWKSTSEIKKTFLNIRNPIDIDRPIGEKGLQEIKGYLRDHKEKLYYEVGASASENSLEFTVPGIGSIRMTSSTTGAAMYHMVNKMIRVAVGKKTLTQDEDGRASMSNESVFQRMGFDGFTHIGGDRMGNGEVHHRVWIAWEPNQIKAIENKGEFDPASDDIYKGTQLISKAAQLISKAAQLVILAKSATPHLSNLAYAGGLHNAALVRSACQHVNETEVGIKGKDGKLISCSYCPDCQRVKSRDKAHHGNACNDAPLDVADMQGEDTQEQGGEKDSLKKGHDVSGESRDADGQWVQGAGDREDALRKWITGSKIVNTDQTPIVMYHGTKTVFGEFSSELFGANTNAKSARLGTFFTDNPNVASVFAGKQGSVLPVFLKVTNPLELGFRNPVEKRQSLNIRADGFTALQDAITKTSGKPSWDKVTPEDVASWGLKVQEMGFDGVWIRNTDMDAFPYTAMSNSRPYHDMVVVFSTDQIKSALGNNGNYAEGAGLRKSVLLIKGELPPAPKADDLKSTDASGKAVSDKPGKPGKVSEDCYKHPESCQLKWITAHPDGELGRGVPLLVHDNGEEYTVVGGAGGKLNQLVFKKPTAQQTLDKQGKNADKEKMKQERIFAARQQLGDKGVELEQRKAALDATAKEQLVGIQNKALAKMGVQFEGSDAVKAITDEARARALKLNPKASPAEQAELANEAVKQARSDAKDAVKRLTQHALDRAAMRSLGVSDGGDSEKFAADIAGRKILKDMSAEDLDDFIGDIAALSQTKAMSRAVTKVLNSGRASAIDGIVASVQPISDADARKQNLSRYLDGRSVNVNAALVRGSELASPATQHRLQSMSAADAINSIVSEHTGQAILGPETVQALGIENSARVAAAYLIQKGNSGKAIGDALQQQVATGAYAAESAALQQADELDVIVAHAKASAGEGTVTQNQASIIAANQAVQKYRILNTCRGQIRATSGVANFLEAGLGGDLELPVGSSLSEARSASKAFGLKEGDFDIREAERGEGGGYILHVAENNLYKLANPQDAGASSRNGDMDRLRADVEASPGHYTPAGWNAREGGPTLAPYQELATRAILQQKHMLLNFGAGVGKTPIYLAAAADALASGKVDRVLITSPQKPLSQLCKGDASKPGGEAGFFLSPEAADQIATVTGGAGLRQALEDLKSGKKKVLAMTPVTMRDHMAELKAAGFGGEKSMYIADEAHYFATGATEGKGSAMARSAGEMAKSEYAVYGTGTAVDNDGCIHASTIIKDVLTGTSMTVSEWRIAGIGPTVFALDKSGRACMAAASIPFIKGRGTMFQVKTDKGHAVTVARLHRFLTPSGWKPLSELREGDYVAALPVPLYGEGQPETSTSSSCLPRYFDTLPGTTSCQFEPCGCSRSIQGTTSFPSGPEINCSDEPWCASDPLAQNAYDLSSTQKLAGCRCDCLSCYHQYGGQLLDGSETVLTSPLQLSDALQCSPAYLPSDAAFAEPRCKNHVFCVRPSSSGDALLDQFQGVCLALCDKALHVCEDTCEYPRQTLREALQFAQELAPGPRLDELKNHARVDCSCNYCTSNWAKLIVINSLCEDDIYDLEVYEHHNYLAHGLWHHNSELHSLYDDLHPGELGPQKPFAAEWLRLSGGGSNLHEGVALRAMRDRLSGGMLSEFIPVKDKKTGREVTLTNSDKSVESYPEQVAAIKVVNAQYLLDRKSPDAGKAGAAALIRDAQKHKIIDVGVAGPDGKMICAKADAADEIARSEKAINPQNRIGLYSQTLAPARSAADRIAQSGTMKNFVSITGAEDERETRKSLASLNDRTNDTDGVILSDAANLGVNGQGMDNIVKMGPMLTAGRENQLNHRHHRTGQTRDVRTTTLVANDPIDEIAQYRVKVTKGKQFALLASMMDDTGVAHLLTQHLDTIAKIAGVDLAAPDAAKAQGS